MKPPTSRPKAPGRTRKLSASDISAVAEQLPKLARAFADKARARKEPLSRSEALAAAPWNSSMPAAWERRFRAAYADRLEELGVSLPAKRSGKSGTSGNNLLPRRPLRQTAEEFAEQDAKARAAGLAWNVWARQKLST